MSEADPIRVLVVDDQDLVRGGFKAILGTYEGIEIVGEARNGADAVQEAQRLRPDVVLMDIRMPEMNGIEATRAITGNPLLAKTRVLVLTTFDVDEYVYDALGAGASGFLLKDADPDEIVAAVRVVARGDALIQPSVMRRLVETFVAARPRGGWGAADVAETRRAALTSLTDREREIVTLRYGLGGRMPRTQREIAKKLGISRSYVSRIEKRALEKLEEAIGERG